MSNVEDVAVKQNTSPKNLTLSASKVHDEVARSVRGSIEHLKYASPKVQLAWGHSLQDGRIHHVNTVENGKGCGCVCPACQEPLISRQGEVLSWHFAHHNGKECRNAVSASVAKFLAQILSEGGGLDLPGVRYLFGNRWHRRPARIGITFDRSEAMESASNQAWEVLAEKVASGKTSRLRVIIRTNPYMALPKAEECREADTSTMLIDLGVVLSAALEIDPELCTNEDWMKAQVVSEAPRDWIWTAAAERLRTNEFNLKVVPYLDAIDAYTERTASEGTSPAEVAIDTLGYNDLVAGQKDQGKSDIPGAFIFARSPSRWRAELLLELVLRPLARVSPENPGYASTVLGWKQSGAACRKLSFVPDPFLRKIDPEILAELRDARPGLQEPVKVIDSYLDELADLGVLRRRPKNAVEAWQSEKYDKNLWNVKGGSYSIAPDFVSGFKDKIEEHPEWRSLVLRRSPS
jgi:hypothetical protein